MTSGFITSCDRTCVDMAVAARLVAALADVHLQHGGAGGADAVPWPRIRQPPRTCERRPSPQRRRWVAASASGLRVLRR